MRDDGAPSDWSRWRAASRAARCSCTGSTGSHTAVFEPSYRGLDCWSGSEHFWLWAAAGESAENSRRIFTVNASIDQAAIGLAAAARVGARIGVDKTLRR